MKVSPAASFWRIPLAYQYGCDIAVARVCFVSRRRPSDGRRVNGVASSDELNRRRLQRIRRADFAL